MEQKKFFPVLILVCLFTLAGCSQEQESSYNKKTVEKLCHESSGLTKGVFEYKYLKKEGSGKSNMAVDPEELDAAYDYYSSEDGLNCGENR